jgi:perosamine synthetase
MVMSSMPLVTMASPVLADEERALVLECLDEGWISSQGRFVTEFETAFASYVGAQHAVAVCNGTAALSLSIMALGLSPGDEVIVPTLTFGATANAVLLAGGTPRFVASDPRYWQIDPDDVAASVNPKTRGIIPVHLYGHPVDLDPILETARAHGLWVLEDAAEAHGARYHDRRVGALADVGTFSFFANKIITTGEGGMCVTNDLGLAERMRIGRDHGVSRGRAYWHERLGSNYRMTNLQAALGIAQLSKIDGFIHDKREVAARYREIFAAATDVDLQLPEEAPWAFSVYWMNNVIFPPGSDRAVVMRALEDEGIESRPFFHPLHTMPAFASCPRSKAATWFEAFSSRGISLPSGANLSGSDVERVASALLAAARGQRVGSGGR